MSGFTSRTLPTTNSSKKEKFDGSVIEEQEEKDDTIDILVCGSLLYL